MTNNVFCSNCGEKVKEGMQFCISCGAKVVQVATDPQPSPSPQTDASGPTTVGAPVTVGSPPTKEEKNKLILFMILSIFIPPVGIVFGIIKYNKNDKKSGQFYLICGGAGILLGVVGISVPYGIGWAVGLLLVASVIYNGMKQIDTGLISAEF